MVDDATGITVMRSLEHMAEGDLSPCWPERRLTNVAIVERRAVATAPLRLATLMATANTATPRANKLARVEALPPSDFGFSFLCALSSCFCDRG